MAAVDQTALEVATQLYLGGYSLKEIKDVLSEQFDKSYTLQTLYNWKRNNDWDSKRTSIVVLKETKVQELVSDRLAEDSENRYRLYGKALEAAERALDGSKFKTGLSVIQGIALAAEGQRKETANSIRREFVVMVERAIKEEYPEIDIDRVKTRLQKIVESENKYD